MKRRKKRRKKKPSPHPKTKVQTIAKLNARREIANIIRLAQKGEGRVVGIQTFIFFSTETGDAWLLEIEENMALCLARGGIAQDVFIQETAEQLMVAWEAQFHISGATFTTITESGQIRAIRGYPLPEILQTAQKMRKLPEKS